jgi:hypothetical protein
MRGWTWAGDAYVYHGQLAASFAFACVYTPAHLRARVGLIIPSRPSSPADWIFFSILIFLIIILEMNPVKSFLLLNLTLLSRVNSSDTTYEYLT